MASPIYAAITTNTYDAHSNLVRQLIATDSNGDGTLESVVTITTTYLIRGLEKSRQVMM